MILDDFKRKIELLEKENKELKEMLKTLRDDITAVYFEAISLDTIQQKIESDDLEEI